MSMSVAGAAGVAMPMAVSGASPMAPPQQKMSNLFSNIDTTGTGSISQSQFAQAFQTMKPPAVFQNAGADAIWSRLDPTGSGQVSQADFVSTMKGLMVELRQGSAASGAQTAEAATAALGQTGQGVNVTV